jgi:hypothetical protein
VLAEPAGGWITYHFAASGDDVNGDGSEGSPFRSFAKAMMLLGPNVRVLFKRGDTFEVTATGSRSTNGPSMLAAYGTGSALPCFTVQGSSGFLAASNMHDTRFVDLWAVGPYPAVSAPGAAFGGLGNGSVVLRNVVENLHDGWHLGWRSPNIIQDSVAVNIKKYHMFTHANPRTAFLGCLLRKNNEEALLRTYTSKLVVAHCDFRAESTSKYGIRLMCSDEPGKEGRWLLCQWNYLPDGQITGAGDSSTTMPTHVLVNGNHLTNQNLDSPAFVQFNGVCNLTVTNNRAVSWRPASFLSLPRGYLSYSYHHRVVSVLNNTLYVDASGAEYRWARFGGVASDVADNGYAFTFLNNILTTTGVTDGINSYFLSLAVANSARSDFNFIHMPTIASPFVLGGARFTLLSWQSAGLDLSSVAGDPMLDLTTGSLAPQAGAPVCGAGTPVTLPWCRLDAASTPRGVTSIAIGAMEP